MPLKWLARTRSDRNGCRRRRRGDFRGDQQAQAGHQQQQDDPARHRAPAEHVEHRAVTRVGGDRGAADILRHGAGDIARQYRGDAGDHHPAAHHQALQAGGGQLANHGVADGGDKQLAKALQHIADGDPLEGDQPVGPRQMDTDRQHQHPQSHAEQGGGKLGGDVYIPPLFAQSLEQQRHQRPTDDDDEGVDVLDPLGSNPQPEHVEVDVVLGEEHQPHGRQLVERPEDEGAEGEDQVGGNPPIFWSTQK